MIEWPEIQKLMSAFPNSLINQGGEFVAHLEANEYFRLSDCETTEDVKCKILEWLSRAAFKTAPFGKRKNDALHAFMLSGINKYLGTSFMPGDMEQIYTYLGNCCNHEKTLRFIRSGYDMAVLDAKEDI